MFVVCMERFILMIISNMTHKKKNNPIKIEYNFSIICPEHKKPTRGVMWTGKEWGCLCDEPEEEHSFPDKGRDK